MIKKIKLFVSAIIFMGGLVFAQNVFADDGGGWIGVGSGTPGSASSGGGGSGCNVDSSWRYREDCTGASWIFYETMNTNNTEPVTFGPTKKLYLGGGKLGSDVTIPAVCSQHENGGVWIYGINGQANKDGQGFGFLGFPAAYWNNGYRTQNGDWAHWVATGFGWTSWLRDEAKSNIYHVLYDNYGNQVYQASKEVYLDGVNKVDIGGAVVSTNPTLLEAYANALKYSGDSWSADNGIQKGTYAFCYWPGMVDVQYSTLSNVSNSKISGYSTTGTNGGELKTVNTATVYASVNDKVTITFSHNAYSSAATDKVSWKMTRSGLESNANYGVEQKFGDGLTGVTSGNNYKFDVPENSRYTTSDRSGKSGSVSYLVREQFEITLLKENKSGYTFCETMGVGPDGETKDYTRACTKIIVSGCVGEECPDTDCVGDDCDPGSDGGPLSNVCGDGKLGTYSTGTTAVLSRVVNPRLAGTFSDWRNLTYAKPNDPIYWTNCYFPGVQEHYNKDLVERNSTIIGTHGAHDTCGCSSNAYEKFQSGITWTNEVTLNTDSPRGFNEWTLNGLGPLQIIPSLSNGDYQTKTYRNSYRIALKNDAGQTYKDDIYTPGTPVKTTYGTEYHSWTKSCPSCCGCGTHRECGGDPVTCWDVCNSGTVTYSHCNDYTVGTYENGSRTEESEVKIPYNFINTAGVEVSVYSSNVVDAVYAGEKINVNNPWVQVTPKDNKVTEYTYATQVDEAQVRLVAYASSSPYGGTRTVKSSKNSEICGLINDDLSGYCNTIVTNDDTTLNEGGYSEDEIRYTNMIPHNGTTFNGTYNVYDVEAGNYMCFVMAVWPYTSGADDNLDKKGDETWFISAPACKVVAKKPSVQILGAGVFSAGSIRTNTSDKINILGIAGYTSQGASDRRVFGSWAEQAVIANGSVEGFASGAATGTWNLYGSDSDKLGGSWEGDTTSFCNNRVSLSFANTSSSYITGICPGAEATGRLGITVSTVNRQALVDYFAAGTKVEGSNGWDGFGSYVRIASGTGKNILYSEEENSSYNISGGTVGGDTTRVVKVTGNVNINSNILYSGATSQNYALVKTGGMVTVPKVVIYASGNINIACDVNEIDAILIAGGTISTCSGFSATDTNTWQNPTRNNKLMIRGAVVANRIDFGRTYGNTTGLGTKEPAEQINYDTSSILWGRSMADAGESDTLTVVYQHELAPRY